MKYEVKGTQWRTGHDRLMWAVRWWDSGVGAVIVCKGVDTGKDAGWRAYLGPSGMGPRLKDTLWQGPGRDALAITQLGTKLSEEEARALFPHLVLPAKVISYF